MQLSNRVVVVVSLILGLIGGGCHVSVGSSSTVEYWTDVPAANAVTKIVNLNADNGEFKKISIQAPFFVETVTEASSSPKVEIKAEVQAESALAIVSFADKIAYRDDGGELSIELAPGLYNCSRRIVNGRAFVKGLCVTRLFIRLPVNSKTSVVVNSSQLNPRMPISVQELVYSLDSVSIDNARLSLVRNFVSSHAQDARFVRVSDVIEIIDTFSFEKNKIEAVRTLSGRVIDRENAITIADSFDFDNAKLQAVMFLSR